MNIEDWVSRQLRLKYRWAGHIARRQDKRWGTILLDWQPAKGPKFGDAGAGRLQGRPKMRWEDRLVDFFADVHPNGWKEVAQSREIWKTYENMFCKQ
eukprot:2566898-Karenia_brevis.AAC.1